MIKCVNTIMLVLASMLCWGQDTVKHYSAGTTGIENAISCFELKSKFIFFGNTGSAGSGDADIYILELDKNMNNPIFSTIGGALSDQLVKILFDETDSTFFLLTKFYDGFVTSSYGCAILHIDQNKNLIKRIEINTSDNEVPISISSYDDSILISYNIIETGTYYYRLFNKDLAQLNNFDLTFDFSFEPVDVLFSDNLLHILGTGMPPDSISSNIILVNANWNGEVIGMVSYGSNKEEIAHRIIQKNDSSFLILGSTRGYTDNVLDFNGLLIEIDSNGAIQWIELLGNIGDTMNTDDIAVDVSLTPRGKIAVGMTTTSFGQGMKDFHLYEVGLSGDFESGRSFGLDEDEIMSKLLCLQDSSYLLFGSTNSMGAGASDFFIVKSLDAQIGKPRTFEAILDTNSSQSLSIEAHNLFSEQIQFFTDKVLISIESPFAVQLISTTGAVLTEVNFDSGLNTFYFPNEYPSGLYVVRIIIDTCVYYSAKTIFSKF